MAYGICNEQDELIAKFTAPITVRSNRPVLVSDTLSLKRQVNMQPAQRWEIDATIEPLSTTANLLFVNLVTKGYNESVRVRFPQNFGVVERTTSTIDPIATGNANSTQISVSGNSGLIPAGTFILFQNHGKVYMTTADLLNNGTVGIFPALRQSLTIQQQPGVKFFKNFHINCLYDTDVISGMRYRDGILMDMGTVKLIERL
jgi:hypothetical protein